MKWPRGRKRSKGKSQARSDRDDIGDYPPPISSLQPMTPPALDRLVKKCLAKEPDDRCAERPRPA